MIFIKRKQLKSSHEIYACNKFCLYIDSCLILPLCKFRTFYTLNFVACSLFIVIYLQLYSSLIITLSVIHYIHELFCASYEFGRRAYNLLQ